MLSPGSTRRSSLHAAIKKLGNKWEELSWQEWRLNVEISSFSWILPTKPWLGSLLKYCLIRTGSFHSRKWLLAELGWWFGMKRVSYMRCHPLEWRYNNCFNKKETWYPNILFDQKWSFIFMATHVFLSLPFIFFCPLLFSPRKSPFSVSSRLMNHQRRIRKFQWQMADFFEYRDLPISLPLSSRGTGYLHIRAL